MFKNIFGKGKAKPEKKEVKSKINWIPLTSLAEIKKIKEDSKDKHIGIFKHSTRCVISTTTLKRFQGNFPEGLDITMYYIDLLNNREVSAEVGYEFQVIHQSPQLLIIKDGRAISHASHYDIAEMDLNQVVK